MVHRSLLYSLGAKVKNKSEEKKEPYYCGATFGEHGVGKLPRNHAAW